MQHASLVALATALVVVGGCSLPRAVLGESDTGVAPMDASTERDTGMPGVDTGPRPDAWSDFDAYVMPGVDAYVPPVDAYVPPVDAYVPPVDAYVPPPDAWTAPSCATTYSDASMQCSETDGECQVIVHLMGPSCAEYCAASGRPGGCTHSYATGPSGMRCMAGGDEPCSTTHGNSFRICVCARF